MERYNPKKEEKAFEYKIVFSGVRVSGAFSGTYETMTGYGNTPQEAQEDLYDQDPYWDPHDRCDYKYYKGKNEITKEMWEAA